MTGVGCQEILTSSELPEARGNLTSDRGLGQRLIVRFAKGYAFRSTPKALILKHFLGLELAVRPYYLRLATAQIAYCYKAQMPSRVASRLGGPLSGPLKEFNFTQLHSVA